MDALSDAINRRGIRLVFMGVCGSGKSTIAEEAAQYLGCGPVIEADSYHSPEMKAKMRAGIPLTDEDRWPWLERLNEAMRTSQASWTVVTCSALRRAYREKLAQGLEDTVRFIFLDAPQSVIASRLAVRSHEYMPASLLESQFRTLERPQSDEPVITVSVAGSTEETLQVIHQTLDALRQLDCL